MKIVLNRTYRDDCTPGEVLVDGMRFFSMERAWLDNKPNVSCIPEGTYKAHWTKSPRLKKYTYEIVGVPNRAGIRIHAGNLASDSLGCPLLGMKQGSLNNKHAVMLSREAVERFNRLGNGKTLTIEIKRAVEKEILYV